MKTATELELSLRAEYEGAALGDSRRTDRLLDMVDAIVKSPDASMPEIFSGTAELEGSYRFLRNDNIEHEAVQATHTAKTAERACGSRTIIVAHDTTEFNFGKKPRKDLGRVGRGKSYGFYGHFSLAIAGDGECLPLGVCALQTHRRDGKLAKNGGKPLHSKRHKDPNNEGLRWFRGVKAASKALQGCENIIHVMDREADDYALLSDMIEHNHRFVIRSSYDRRTENEQLKISDVLQTTSFIEGTREISLSKRDSSSMPAQKKRHPPRKKRTAQLSVRAASLIILRPKSAPTKCPTTIKATLVQVIEQSPPEGEPPVVWNLWTTESCETAEQLWAVVDAYRARWIIEEYFKAIKTGCSYESRQFEREATLLRALTLFIPVAWWLLMLRTLNRVAPERPATSMLDPLQIHCLRGALGKIRVELPSEPSISDLLRGIARLGGHIPRNGEPGWLVLLRGLEKLTLLAEGFKIARASSWRAPDCPS